MTQNKFVKKINDFFAREYYKGAADISIFRNEDGSYELFNTFIIFSEKNKFKVTKKTSFISKNFASLKNAVTWCIYEQRNKITESQRIEELDRLIFSLDAEIELHKQLIEKTKNIDNKLIYYAKLTDEQVKRKTLAEEITKYVKISEAWQTDRFNKKDQKYI